MRSHPLGSPETVRLTVPALPEVTAVEIVLEPLAGLAEIEKSDAVKVSDTVAECVIVPSVPVTVSV